MIIAVWEFSPVGNRKREDMGMCEFCELYMTSKEIAKEKKLNHGINSTFKAVLREIKTKDRIRKGTIDGKPMKLVYCPTCGKKLSELK